MVEQLYCFLKPYCTPEKACNFIFSAETPSKNVSFKENASQNHVQIKSYTSFYFFNVASFLANYQNRGKFLE